MYSPKPLNILNNNTSNDYLLPSRDIAIKPNFAIEAIDHHEFHNLNRGRVAVFIDGANLYYAALQLGIEINYSKLLTSLTSGARLLRAFFYTGVDSANEKQQNFLLWMRRNGYRVVTKELIQFADGSKKADMAVEIAVDMMTLVGHYDTAVLVSGDGDLAYATKAISYQGIRIELVSLRSMTSDSLMNFADTYIDIEDIKSKIQKKACTNFTSIPDLKEGLGSRI